MIGWCVCAVSGWLVVDYRAALAMAHVHPRQPVCAFSEKVMAGLS
jgi:hypothetical protein